MKNIILISALFFLFANTYSQTKETELRFLKNKFENGEITITEYKEMGQKWEELMKIYNGYPKFPYDPETNSINYIFTKEYPNLTKNIIYNRIKEWAAISFGNINSVLHYENYENGKIIIKGFFDILTLQDYKGIWGKEKSKISKIIVSNTYIFTLNESKIKIQFTNTKFNFKYSGYYTNNNYFPSYTITEALSWIYPITNSEVINWKLRLSILNQTTIKTNKTIQDINNYIENYKNDYSF